MSDKKMPEDSVAENTPDSVKKTADKSIQPEAAENDSLNTEESNNVTAESEKEEKTSEAVEETPLEVDKTDSKEEETPIPSEEKAKPEVIAEAKAKEEAVTEEEAKEIEEEAETEDEEEVASSDDEEEDDNDEADADIDYHELSKKELIAEFRRLLETKSVQQIKNDVEEIRSEFNTKFNEELEQQKEDFLAEGGNIIDFHYSTPLRKEFNSLYFDYKERRNNHFKNLKKDLQANLEKRLELIEELKSLLNAEENINTTYKHFKEIQERWHTAGPIPRDKYNLVWNTYHHHVENFYDFLHLNREFRDMDFKHNLEQKLKLINRAEELHQETNVPKAFRELQMLHKMWKEEVGPVAKEFREEVWEKFSAATKVIHDKRQDYLSKMESEFDENFDKKMEIVKEIIAHTNLEKPSHQNWQNAIKKVQALRDRYFEIGKVPRAKNKEIWTAFKEATRNFNKEKNAFYKNQKKEQYTNLEKKRELIKIAQENKDGDDFEVVTPLMKKIQAEWKKIGHVPRKESDKVWKEFKDACNHYFDRLHSKKNEDNKEELEHFKQKSELLEQLKSMELSGDKKADLKSLKEHIASWKKIGRVPYNKRQIDQKFNKALDGMFAKLDLNKKESEMIKFENKLNSMVSQEDERKLKNEHFFISKKIDETKSEIRQLENNLGFFQHVPDDNPLVKEVHQNIARHKEQLDVWKAKLKRIKTVRDID